MNDVITTSNLLGCRIRMAYRRGNPLFVIKDVCAALGIVEHLRVSWKLDKDEKVLVVVKTARGYQKMSAATYAGLYEIIFNIRKPKAIALRHRLMKEQVIPALRKARFGFYSDLFKNMHKAPTTDPFFIQR